MMKSHKFQIFLWRIFIPQKFKNYEQYLKDGMSDEFAYRRAKEPEKEIFTNLLEIIKESHNVESKKYFKEELKLREQEADMIYDLYCKHRKVRGGLCPSANFSIRYEYCSIGVGRYLEIEGQSFPLNDDIDF